MMARYDSSRAENIQALLPALYEAAQEPELVPEFLARIANELSLASFGMGCYRLSPPCGLIEIVTWDHSFDAAVMDQAYREYMTPEVNPFVRNLHKFPVGRAVRMSDFEIKKSWYDSSFVEDIFLSQGLSPVGLGLLERDLDYITSFTLFRDRGTEEADDEELALVDLLIPHFTQAVRIARRLQDVAALRDGLADVTDRMMQGVVLFDAAGRAVFVNRMAEEIFAARDGLTLRDGRLRSVWAEDTAALQRLVAEAAATGAGRGAHSGGTLSLPRPSGLRPLAVQVTPFRAAGDGTGRLAPAAAAFIADPERRHEAPETVLARLYGLTPREAALAAALAQGRSVPEAAEMLGLTQNTARFHLKSVYAKTGAARQSDLVSLVLAGPAGLRGA